MAGQEPVGSVEQSPSFQLRQEHPSLGPCDVTVMGVASSHGKRSPCSRGSRENSHDGRDLRRMVVLELAGVPGSASRHPLEDVLKPSLGTVRVLENKTTAIGGNITKREQDLEQAQDTLASAEANIGKPFVDADVLEAARDRAADLAAQLAESTSEEDEPTAAADGAHPPGRTPPDSRGGLRASAVRRRGIGAGPDHGGGARTLDRRAGEASSQGRARYRA